MKVGKTPECIRGIYALQACGLTMIARCTALFLALKCFVVSVLMYQRLAEDDPYALAEFTVAIFVISVQAIAPSEILRKASQVFGGSGPVSLDEQGRKRSEAAIRNLQTYADSGGVGLKMLSKMGFGASGSGLGRDGQVRWTC